MASERASPAGPPCFVLISESALSNTNYSTEHASLVHPIVHYRYADDPPLCPTEAGTSLLMMDFDPTSPNSFTVSSLSPHLAIDNVAVSEAPGAGSAGYINGSPSSNNNLYVIRTLAVSNDKSVAHDVAEHHA
jgi:hypothetical protein